MPELARCRRNVKRQVQPFNARARACLSDGLVVHRLPKQVGKIDSCSAAQSMPRPYPCVDLEKLVRLIAWIVLEFNFSNASILYSLKQSLRGSFNLTLLNSLDEGASTSKIDGILPRSPRDE